MQKLSDKAKKLLAPQQKCIVNMDIDGVLSGALLKSVLDWRVVGWCDSKNKLWLSEDIKNFSDVTFVDIFVAPPELKCIDQHLVAIDESHAQALSKNPNKLNPNLELTRYASPDKKNPCSYPWKYPFGSVHFLIAVLEMLGHDINLKLDTEVLGPISSIDVLLRCDDAARTTSHRYTENAKKWWSWLCEIGGKTTEKISKYANNLEEEYTEDCYNELWKLFRTQYGSHTKDGNFAKSLENSSGVFDATIKQYLSDSAKWFGLEKVNHSESYYCLAGDFKTAASYPKNQSNVKKLLEKQELFSYAFTFLTGRLAEKGFSYTEFPPNGTPTITPGS